MQETTVSSAWHGWLFLVDAQRWCHVCVGDSLSQCHRRMIREAKRWGVLDKHCWMTGGASPTFTPETRSTPEAAQQSATEEKSQPEASHAQR